MKKWVKSNILYITGALAGGIAGYLYWKFVGCSSGTCSITSSPRNSTLYFAFMGALVFSMFKREKAKPEAADKTTSV